MQSGGTRHGRQPLLAPRLQVGGYRAKPAKAASPSIVLPQLTSSLPCSPRSSALVRVRISGRAPESRGNPSTLCAPPPPQRPHSWYTGSACHAIHRPPHVSRVSMILRLHFRPCTTRWPVVGGRWSVVGGRWSVARGRWSVVGGRWSVVGGRWSVVVATRR